MNASELAAELLAKGLEKSASRRTRPESTYRLQFHAGFTFRDATAIVPYLHDLGITHCYASPYLKARPGSTHGYDIIDHGLLNPEIGSPQEYEEWVCALHAHGMGQIVDTVPNHMGVGTNDNPWWNDVLENGPSARFAPFFDIAWSSSSRPELRDKVLLPVLADLYGDALEDGQFTISFKDGALSVHYGDRRFPIAPRSYSRILGIHSEELEKELGPDDPSLIEFQSILTAVRNLPGSSETEPEKVAERNREKEVIKRRLAALASGSSPIRDFIDRNVALFTGVRGEPQSFELMHDLLENQCYRLSYWRVGSDEINYRRFFDVNDLAALAMERQDVFEAAHALLLQLVAHGKVDGLRIDHPDGLYDPATYFHRIQDQHLITIVRQLFEESSPDQGASWEEVEAAVRSQLAARQNQTGGHDRDLYVVIEKILGSRETLVEDWPVHGTSGYDFLNQLNGLFVDGSQVGALTQIYHSFIDSQARFFDLVYFKKLVIMQVSLSSELHMLTHQLDDLAQKSRRSRDFTFNSLRHALREVIACFPVYRSYIDSNGPSPTDRRQVEAAVRRARIRNPAVSDRIFRFIRDMLLLESADTLDENERAERQRFAGKFQQVTAPVIAKGLEDTAFYIYNRLISLNEVGGDPDRFGVRPELMHAYCRDRREKWPFALSALSTHDTKRSEDVRARINVLSEMPSDWRAALDRWHEQNAPRRSTVDDEPVPDRNEEYMIYQTLLGAWPLESGDTDIRALADRVTAYMQKAVREAKVHSSWINPDADYEDAVDKFIREILDESKSASFLDDFRKFQLHISRIGMFNSLSQTLLKLTAPGVPDTYQGTELWDFSLVDPDNRRRVDYGKRIEMLHGLKASLERLDGDDLELCRQLLASKEDGRIKLFVHQRALALRCRQPGLLTAGEYVALNSVGSQSDHIFAFARRFGAAAVMIVVPRLMASLLTETNPAPCGASIWHDTQIIVPDELATAPWHNLLTGENLETHRSEGQAMIAAASLLAHFPIALLLNEATR
jgi:(1->4)-alpha-D-glucan 1-alpha-D-glucosylmutase